MNVLTTFGLWIRYLTKNTTVKKHNFLKMDLFYAFFLSFICLMIVDLFQPCLYWEQRNLDAPSFWGLKCSVGSSLCLSSSYRMILETEYLMQWGWILRRYQQSWLVMKTQRSHMYWHEDLHTGTLSLCFFAVIVIMFPKILLLTVSHMSCSHVTFHISYWNVVQLVKVITFSNAAADSS